MRIDRRHIISLALFATVVVQLLAGCGGGTGDQADASLDAVPVEVSEATVERVSPTIEYSGTVQAGRKALLGAEIQGRIEKIYVDVGDEVRAGEVLAELASEQLEAARARAVTAQKDWDRARDLLEKKAITPQAYDHALAALEVARASHEMIAASSRLEAPFDGIVTERYLDEGELYTLMPTAAASPAIFEVADLTEVKVTFEVGERERMFIEKGLKAAVTVDSHPGRSFEGNVTRVDPSLDLMSRTATVDVTVENGNSTLRPGVFADVLLTLKPREVLAVPRDALIRQEGTGLFFVYMVEDNAARRRVVELGGGFGERVEVLEGLEGGEVVVTAGRYRLHDGARVAVRDGAAAQVAQERSSGATESGEEGPR
jgi:RND family efflux transporter MFP subunit